MSDWTYHSAHDLPSVRGGRKTFLLWEKNIDFEDHRTIYKLTLQPEDGSTPVPPTGNGGYQDEDALFNKVGIRVPISDSKQDWTAGV